MQAKEVYDKSLEETLKEVFGQGIEITGRKRISGGDINDAWQISLSSGEKVFAKTNAIRNVQFFVTEAAGLRALRAAGKIGVPKVLGLGADQRGGVSFLLLEYMDSAPRIRVYWETFGHELAGLHRAECACFVKNQGQKGKYGFSGDNFIGSTPQKNTPKESWIDFYRECRLEPQIKLAEPYLDSGMRKKCGRLLEHLDAYLREPEFPSLLHGDLWSGNVLCGNDGKAWILDPAAYVGDFEADLAMTQLFGSFPSVFYEAYREVNPFGKEYLERRDLYHLYQLLNHLNLFGSMYLGSVAEILNEYV